jgi:hypothetical protein
VIVPLQPALASGEIGSVAAGITIALSGVSARGNAGTVSVAPRLLSLTGNRASGFTGNVIAVYWQLIDDSETANWQNITNSQTPNWNIVDNAETADWEEIAT